MWTQKENPFIYCYIYITNFFVFLLYENKVIKYIIYYVLF